MIGLRVLGVMFFSFSTLMSAHLMLTENNSLLIGLQLYSVGLGNHVRKAD